MGESENRLEGPWRCCFSHQQDSLELRSIWPQCFTPSRSAPLPSLPQSPPSSPAGSPWGGSVPRHGDPGQRAFPGDRQPPATHRKDGVELHQGALVPAQRVQRPQQLALDEETLGRHAEKRE